MNVIETENLTKIFGEKHNQIIAVNGINLEVKAKEFVAVVGTSGSGKSTLLNLIGGLDSPTKGRIRISGQDLVKLNDEEKTIFRRRNIGFVFQNYNLIPVLSTYENIVLPIELDGKRVDKEFVTELISKLGLKGKEKNLPFNLSGGQQQRVAIGRTLASKPALILADEPTGNLDSRSSQDVLDLLKMVNQQFNQTIVMITHNDEMAKLSDRILRIEDGKLQTQENLR